MRAAFAFLRILFASFNSSSAIIGLRIYFPHRSKHMGAVNHIPQSSMSAKRNRMFMFQGKMVLGRRLDTESYNLFGFIRFLWRYPVKLINRSAIQVSDRTVKHYRLAMMINVKVQSECLCPLSLILRFLKMCHSNSKINLLSYYAIDCQSCG